MSERMKPVSRIATFRERAGMTQRELSLLIGVTDNTIQNWEKGRAGIEQIERLIRLCQVLNCNLEDLIEYVPMPESQQSEVGDSLAELRRLLGTDKPPKTNHSQATTD